MCQWGVQCLKELIWRFPFTLMSTRFAPECKVVHSWKILYEWCDPPNPRTEKENISFREPLMDDVPKIAWQELTWFPFTLPIDDQRDWPRHRQIQDRKRKHNPLWKPLMQWMVGDLPERKKRFLTNCLYNCAIRQIPGQEKENTIHFVNRCWCMCELGFAICTKTAVVEMISFRGFPPYTTSASHVGAD